MEQTNTPQQPSRKKAILSLLVLLALYAGTGKRGLAAAAQIAAGVCALVSLGPLLLGIRNYSVTGALITASLLAECLWLCRVWRSKREDS